MKSLWKFTGCLKDIWSSHLNLYAAGLFRGPGYVVTNYDLLELELSVFKLLSGTGIVFKLLS